jgi:probable rRNA maturation factor
MSRSSGPSVRIVRRRQGGISITATELRALVVRALRDAGAPRGGEAVVTLVDDREITKLNEMHMKKHGATDVLSFPLLEPTAYPARPGTPRRAVHPRATAAPLGDSVPLGDIVISVDRAIDQARAGRGGVDGKTAHTPADELRLLAVHGALHLCGWDHGAATAERAMWAEQERILRAHSRAMRRTLVRA